MTSIRNYFETDHNKTLNVRGDVTMNAVTDSGRCVPYSVPTLVHWDFESNSKYLSFLLPPLNDVTEICKTILDNMKQIVSHVEGDIVISRGPEGAVDWEKKMSTQLIFCGRVFFYVDKYLNEKTRKQLNDSYENKNIYMVFRDNAYIDLRRRTSPPVAFISFDSSNRKDVAEPLARSLSARRVPVWFDEYELKPGELIKEQLCKGIDECGVCILIISEQLIRNQSHARWEVDKFLALENTSEGGNFHILPIWVGVNKEQVTEFNSKLGERLAVSWENGIEHATDVLARLLASSSDGKK